MKIPLKKSELLAIVLSILVVAFVFGFDDGRETFKWSYWLANFLTIFIIVTIALIVHILAHKLVAKHYNSHAEYKIWGIKRFWFTESSEFETEAPIGVILPLIVLFFSFMLTNEEFILPFVAIETFMLTSTAKLGKKYTHLTEFEESKIALAGPLASIALAFFFKFLTPINPAFNNFVTISSLIAVCHMLPIPHLDGIKVYFGSKTFYVLSYIFILASTLLLYYANIMTSLLLAIIFAVVIAVSYHYYFRT